MKKEHRGVKPNLELKDRVKGLVNSGVSFVDTAKICGLKSKQLARYHYITGKKYGL